MKLPLLVLLLPLTLSAYSAKAYDNDYCREFTKQVRVGGQWQQAYGTACYRPDGSWEVVQEPRVRHTPTRIVHDDDDDYAYDDRRVRPPVGYYPPSYHPHRPPVIVNYWEDRWSPGRHHGHWRKPCHRRDWNRHGGRHHGYGYRNHHHNSGWNISYSF